MLGVNYAKLFRFREFRKNCPPRQEAAMGGILCLQMVFGSQGDGPEPRTGRSVYFRHGA